MHQRLAEIMEYAERSREELLAVVAEIPADLHRRRVQEGAWSVAEVLAHLHLVEHGSVRAMFRALKNARLAGLAVEEETSSLLGALDRFRLTEVVRPMEAPEFTRPTGDEDVPALLGRLAESRDALRAWAGQADGFALGAVSWPHPLLGEFSLYEWALLIGQHERRHTQQLRAIAQRTPQ